jgi:DNA-nicking Smr family endonuclease
VSKKKDRKKSDEPELPKFGGFHQLEGLQAFKEKLKEEEAKNDAAAAKEKKRPPPPPVRAAPDKRTAQTDKEDELSFHRMMAGVTPLDAKAARVPVSGEAARGPARPRPAELRAKAQQEAADVIDHLRGLVDDKTRFEVSDDGHHVEGRRVDVPPALLRDLRHGRLPIDGRLDLHGLAPDEARERVTEFLRQKRTAGERCVLVIHGKGEGVLRGEIAAWLSQGKARDYVAAFATATDRDGGEGAVYVALRR